MSRLTPGSPPATSGIWNGRVRGDSDTGCGAAAISSGSRKTLPPPFVALGCDPAKEAADNPSGAA
jgi:hypothetical protein